MLSFVLVLDLVSASPAGIRARRHIDFVLDLGKVEIIQFLTVDVGGEDELAVVEVKLMEGDTIVLRLTFTALVRLFLQCHKLMIDSQQVLLRPILLRLS